MFRLLLVPVVLMLTAPLSAQTLAEAAAKAKEDRAKGMGWPAPVAPKEIATGQIPVAPASDGAAKEAPAPTKTETTTTTKDKKYWNDRMRALTTKLADDQLLLSTMEAQAKTLDQTAHKSVLDHDAVRDRRQLAVLENQWQDAVKEVSRLKALVANDRRAITDFELEAHKAGVPPGWLVLE